MELAECQQLLAPAVLSVLASIISATGCTKPLGQQQPSKSAMPCSHCRDLTLGRGRTRAFLAVAMLPAPGASDIFIRDHAELPDVALGPEAQSWQSISFVQEHVSGSRLSVLAVAALPGLGVLITVIHQRHAELADGAVAGGGHQALHPAPGTGCCQVRYITGSADNTCPSRAAMV